jgi:hypothetical protein
MEKPIAKAAVAKEAGSKDFLDVKTLVNWIPVAIPPRKEGRYLVWIRQEGSILKGRIGTFWYYPNAGIWEITIEFKEGEQLDLWADVMPPFFHTDGTEGKTNLDRGNV